MRFLNIPFLLSAALLVASCQTQYQEGNFSGGVQAQKIANDTYRISGSGNGYTSAATIQDYVLLKASETALANGKTHFVSLSSADRTRTDRNSTAATITNYGNSLYVNPGYSYDVVKPGQDTIIKIFTPSSNSNLPYSAYNAQEVFNAINPRVERPKPKKIKVDS
jgi:hypothetical protein